MADGVWAEGRRFLRFLVVGGGLFALDFAAFTALVEWGLDVPYSQSISVTLRTIVGFVAHKWVTFRGETSDDAATTARQSIAYLVQGVVNAPVSVAVVWACVGLLDGWAAGGKLLAEAVLVVEVYLLYRVIVYSRRFFGAEEPGSDPS